MIPTIYKRTSETHDPRPTDQIKMALRALIQKLEEKFPTETLSADASTIMTFITEYADEEAKKYEQNKANNAITWGKYKGYTPKELSLTEKGKDYLAWCLSQTWMTDDKFGSFIAECSKLGIKKKIIKRVPLN